MTTDIEALRASCDLAAVVGQYVELKREGRELVGLCPFHAESTPSFKVNPDKQIWACFGCGQNEQHGADVFGFIRSYFDCTFPEAIAKLQNGSGGHDAKPIPREPLKKAPVRQTFLHPDGQVPDMVHRELGEPIKVWTIREANGTPYFYEARYKSLTDPKGKETRFWSFGRYSEADPPRWECRHPMNPRPFYGLERIDERDDKGNLRQVMIHEAPKKAEAAAALFRGQIHLGLIGGRNAVPYTDLTPLKGRRCILLPDNDEVGRQAMRRLAPLLHAAGAAEVKGIDPETQPDGSLTPDGWDLADSEGWTPEIALEWARTRVFPHPLTADEQATDAAEAILTTPASKAVEIQTEAPPVSAYSTQEVNGHQPAAKPAKAQPAKPKPAADGLNGHEPGTAAEFGIISRRLSDVEFRPIDWLWTDRLPCGKVSMIVGNPGLGKSQVTASLAAVVTTGGKWPVTREKAPIGSVIILSAEDDAEDTIGPRLEAAGADTTKIHILDAIRTTDEHGREAMRGFDLSLDISRLVILMNEIGDVRLVIIDPVSAYMGKTDSHNNSEVRGILAPLTRAAAKCGASIIIVSHLNKSQGQEALLRTQGSIGFTGAARAVWGVAKDKENPSRRLFMPLKNNLGTDETGLAYSIESFKLAERDPEINTSRVMWEGQLVSLSAEEVFGQQADEERTRVTDAKFFLSDALAEGWVKTADLQLAARKAGHAWTTVVRAKDQMKVAATRKGGMAGSGSWGWELPGSGKSSRDYANRED